MLILCSQNRRRFLKILKFSYKKCAEKARFMLGNARKRRVNDYDLHNFDMCFSGCRRYWGALKKVAGPSGCLACALRIKTATGILRGHRAVEPQKKRFNHEETMKPEPPVGYNTGS